MMLTSFAGLFTPQWMVGCYASSKHAAEAFSSALRAEMIPFGVEVTTGQARPVHAGCLSV